MTITPIFSNFSFCVELHSEPKVFLCLTHGLLSDLNDRLCDLFSPTSHLHLIVNPSHVLKVSTVVKSEGYEVFFKEQYPLFADQCTC